MTLHALIIAAAICLSINIVIIVDLLLRWPTKRSKLPDYLRRAL